MGLKAVQEWPNGGAADSWKKFHSYQGAKDPVLTVNYNLPPTVGAMATVPSTPCVIGAGRPHVSSIPQLQALIHDPEADAVSAEFEWWVTGGSMIRSVTEGPGAAGTWLPVAEIPPGDLPDGGTYSWRVRGYDGHRWSGWSGWCEFTLDSQAPTRMATSPPTPCLSTSGGSDTASLPRINPVTVGLTLKARVDDINGGNTQARFEWWPKATKGVSGMVGSHTTTPPAPVGSTFTAGVAAGGLTNGTAYSWRVRGHDGGFVKPWAAWCEFVVDTAAPGAPSVSAAPGNDLQLAGPGVTPPLPSETAVVGRPTQVTFTPAGGTDANVVAYLWGINGPATRWAPASPNGSAVVTVMVEPLTAGFEVNELTVLAVDRAGNRSVLPAGTDYTVGFKANPAAGWWHTNGSAGPIQDLTENDNDLPLGGGASLGYGVLTLNGTSAYAATVGPVLDTTDSYTVAAWVRATTLTNYRVAVSQNGTTETAFRLQYRPTENRWCMVLSESDTVAPAENKVCASSAPAAGVWTHLAGVYNVDTNEMSLYVDGVLQATASAGTVWAAGGPLEVGRRLSEVPTQYLAGDVADVRAWQRVLDPAGIAALAKLPPSAGAWGMDDASATGAPDVSGLSAEHPATVSGAAGWNLGHSGTGLYADGVSGAAGTTGPVVRTDTSFTVSAWVFTTDTSTGTFRTAVAQEAANISGFYLLKAQDRWSFTRLTSDSAGAGVVRANSTAAFTPNTWVHLTGVYDSSAGQLRLYVNGALNSTAAFLSGWNATGSLVIGRAKHGGPENWWPGRIDDVRLFRGALSTTQIQYLASL